MNLFSSQPFDWDLMVATVLWICYNNLLQYHEHYFLNCYNTIHLGESQPHHSKLTVEIGYYRGPRSCPLPIFSPTLHLLLPAAGAGRKAGRTGSIALVVSESGGPDTADVTQAAKKGKACGSQSWRANEKWSIAHVLPPRRPSLSHCLLLLLASSTLLVSSVYVPPSCFSFWWQNNIRFAISRATWLPFLVPELLACLNTRKA
jgi:hypothetical protein